MSQGIPPGYVLPTPQRAKLVGTLNIVFGSLLIVYILFQIAMLFFTPALMQMSGDMIKQAQTKAEQQRKDQLAELKKKAAEAKTAEEKSELEQQQRALEKSPQVNVPDMSKVADMMKTPAYQAYVWSDMIRPGAQRGHVDLGHRLITAQGVGPQPGPMDLRSEDLPPVRAGGCDDRLRHPDHEPDDFGDDGRNGAERSGRTADSGFRGPWETPGGTGLGPGSPRGRIRLDLAHHRHGSPDPTRHPRRVQSVHGEAPYRG